MPYWKTGAGRTVQVKKVQIFFLKFAFFKFTINYSISTNKYALAIEWMRLAYSE